MDNRYRLRTARELQQDLWEATGQRWVTRLFVIGFMKINSDTEGREKYQNQLRYTNKCELTLLNATDSAIKAME